MQGNEIGMRSLGFAHGHWGRVLSPVAGLQLDFCGASSSAFLPFSKTPSRLLQAQFGEEISLRGGNLPSPCVRVRWVRSYSSAKDFFRLYAEYLKLEEKKQ